MKIEKITEQKKRFLDLLLLADEQESMIWMRAICTPYTMTT